MIKTSMSQVKFTNFVIGDKHHFAADWDDQSCKYTWNLNKEVRKELKRQAKARYGYWSGVTGSSVYALTP